MDNNFLDFNAFEAEYGKDVTLNTPIGVYTVSAKCNRANALKQRYKVFAAMAVEHFKEAISNYDDISDFINNGDKDFQESIVPAMEDLHSAFISVDDFEKDYQTMFDMANKQNLLDPFDEAFGYLIARAQRIADDLQDEKDYRQYRKDNRSRWVGGTIGGNTLNAVNTQMKIGAMNAAGGAAHGLVNAAGNLMSEIEAERKLKNLFESDSVRNSVLQGVYDSVLNLRFVLIKEAGGKKKFTVISQADEEKAQRLVNNLKDGMIKDEKLAEVCVSVLDTDPYNADFYNYLFEKFGDDGSLHELATFFGIDTLIAYKDEKALEYVKNNQGETEEDSHKAKELLKEYMESIRLDYDENLSCVTYIDTLIADFDRQYRTVEGVEHETRDGADFSREELPKIHEFMEDVHPLQGEPLLPYEKALLVKKEEFDGLFSSEIAQKYSAIIQGYLDKFDKAFLKVGLLGTSNREEAKKKRALKYAKGLKYQTVEEFDRQYATFCQFILDNLEISIDEATEAKAYLDKKRDKLINGSTLSNLTGNVSKGLKGLFGKK